MPRGVRNQTNGNGNRQAQIDWMKETIAENSVIYLISRGNVGASVIVSCFRLFPDSFGEPKIENIDYQVGQILGYKFRDEENSEGLLVMGVPDTIGVSIAASLAYTVLVDYSKYSHKWL